MRPADWLLLSALGAIWGSSFFFQRVALDSLEPFSIVLARVLLAAIALLVILRARGLSLPRSFALWRDFTILGLFNSLIPFTLIIWGQQYIESGLAAILNATVPLFAVTVAHFALHDEKMTANRIGGILAGICGVAVMIGPDALSGMAEDVLAQLAVIGAALCYAIAGVFSRRFRSLPPLVPATGQVVATAMMAMPLAFLFERPQEILAAPPAVLASLLSLGLVSTALAYIMYFHLIATRGSTNASLVTFIIPVSGTLLGSLVLHERLELRHFFGMLLIALGLAAINGELLARFQRRRPGAD